MKSGKVWALATMAVEVETFTRQQVPPSEISANARSRSNDFLNFPAACGK